MTRDDITDRFSWAQSDINWLRGLQTNCTTCDDFTKETGFCKRHGGNPPADFLQQAYEQ